MRLDCQNICRFVLCLHPFVKSNYGSSTSPPVMNIVLLLLAYVLGSRADQACNQVNPRCRPVVFFPGTFQICNDDDHGRFPLQMHEDYLQSVCGEVCVICIGYKHHLTNVLTDMPSQLTMVRKAVESTPALANGFNLVGYSQGALLARAYVQVYGNVHNLISLSGPQAGIDDCPMLGYLARHHKLCEEIVNVATREIYQLADCSFCGYWKGQDRDVYLSSSTFLADINNDLEVKNETYRRNMISLNQYVVVRANQDQIVKPKNSSYHEFYPWGGGYKNVSIAYLGTFDNFATHANYTIPLADDPGYQGDWIGLKMLNESNRLKLLAYDGQHLEISQDWYHENFYPWLIESSDEESDRRRERGYVRGLLSDMLLATRARFKSRI